MTERTFGSYRVKVSHPTKVLFPDCGLTKGDLVSYYSRVANLMLPHIRDRPLTLHRFPDGIDAEGFFQQSRGDHFPDWLDDLPVEHGGDTGCVHHITAQRAASLAYLANQGAITLHHWLSRKDNLQRPDQMIFDLDPPGEDFEPVRQAAHWVADCMRDHGLTPFLKTTGSRGLHVVAPLRPEADFERVRAAARTLAERLAAAHPDHLTTAQRKDRRKGRLYLDVMRNAFGQTAVAPYSVRARPGAPVATPLAWDELDDADLGPRRYRVDNLLQRLGTKPENPWSGMHRHAVRLQTLEHSLTDRA